ncbi:MAG TPA: ferredoxin--NADP reductase [Trebonia sp.]|nr:ferredoxin--NADP reductase [Trebonia sp.]
MARDHGFHETRILRVIDETPDARTYVLDAPFSYLAGQFVTFRACGALRSYSMSSSPDTDAALATTVKRVPGGLVSNWLIDNLKVGDVVEVTAPTGVFTLRDSEAPLVALAGGSGVTPIMSLAKSALAATSRRVRILLANRDADSAIFAAALEELIERYPGRLEVRHHLDEASGLVTEAEIADFAGNVTHGADFYLCGPEPFMDLVGRVLAAQGVDEERILTERFSPAEADEEPARLARDTAGPTGGTITITLDGTTTATAHVPGITLLEHARRAGLKPPFSCEAGNCATCMGRLEAGQVTMRVNNALDDDEVADGYVLTCQSVPATPDVTVIYEY